MTIEEDFKLLKIQTCVLRVNIHCDGCKQKVKKLLHRIKGVYQVNVDSDQQKVTVSGSVDSATLIKKLVRAGKHAELWSQKPNQNQKQKNNNNFIKEDKNNSNSKGHSQKQGLNLMKGLEAFKNQHHQNHKFAPLGCEDNDDYHEDDEDNDCGEEEDDLRFLREKVNQLGLLRQQAMEAANEGKKRGQNNVNINNNNGQNGKKAHTIQNNMGLMKASSPNGMGINQKTMAALKLGNNLSQFGEARGVNDLNTMMNLAGFHGNVPNNNNLSSNVSSIGPNNINNNAGHAIPNGLGGFQIQQPSNGFGQQYSQVNMTTGFNNNNNHHQSQMINMMNLHQHQQQQARQAMMMQQPQLMYQRSPYVPPNTGYYYHYNSPHHYYQAQAQPYHDPSYASDSSASHMFSDENTSGCSIM